MTKRMDDDEPLAVAVLPTVVPSPPAGSRRRLASPQLMQDGPMNGDIGIAAPHDSDCKVVRCARVCEMWQFIVTASVPSQDGSRGLIQLLHHPKQ